MQSKCLKNCVREKKEKCFLCGVRRIWRRLVTSIYRGAGREHSEQESEYWEEE